jgi:hypothetical protein
MKVYEFIIDENSDERAVQAISLVESPAIEEDFIALKSEDKKQIKVEFKAADIEKRIVTGPALIPKKLIFRKDEGEGFYIYFTDQTIEKAAQLYLKDGNQFNTTLQHEQDINDVTLVESWLKIDDKDKSTALGFDLPNGTWMVSLKIDNDDIWNDFVKTGKVKGFSIEGVFSGKLIQQQKEEENSKAILQKIRELIAIYATAKK